MKLWIVETFAGTCNVVFAEDQKAAAAGVRDTDKALVTDVREWPADSPFSVAFEPRKARDGSVWLGIPDRGSSKALGDAPRAIAIARDFARTLRDEHECGHHVPASEGYIEYCPTCRDDRAKQMMPF